MSRKILVVDDNINNVRLLKDILEDENYDVITSTSGLYALEIAKIMKPSLVLLDIMMPEVDGFEVCRKLKGDFDTKEIPIIMVTAKVEGENLKNALEIGAIDYIKKPIDEIELIARIESALRTEDVKKDLKDKASKDALTGLYNRGLLIDSLEKEIIKQDISGDGVSYVMLDIDFFKKINDTYGHASGDIVLKELADILNSSVRVVDTIGRYGGEEFGLVLTKIALEDAYRLCNRIRETVEKHVFNVGTDLIKITISIGFSHRESAEAIDSDNLIRRADQALYSAKNNGRNRVEGYIKSIN